MILPDKKNLLALSFSEIDTLVEQLGWKKYRAGQIRAWLYQHHAASIDEMTTLTRAEREGLSERFVMTRLNINKRQVSLDGTEKFLMGLGDGREVESVLIPDDERLTACISTQVGCSLDCGFCLTAREGLKRNLKTEEIVDQVLVLKSLLLNQRRVTNIVLMGMGEPLANLGPVSEALRRMTSPMGLGISPRRITLSTAGMVPQIRKFWKEAPPVNLSISLNATTNAVRDRIMPAVNRLYPIEVLLSVCREFPLPARRRLTFEYVLLSGVNDTMEDAGRLVVLTKGVRCKINLIPFNEFPGGEYRRPSDRQVLQFQEILLKGGLIATLRKSKGRDILAACGQLTSVGSTATGPCCD